MVELCFVDILRWGLQQNTERPGRRGADDRRAAGDLLLEKLSAPTSISPESWSSDSAGAALARLAPTISESTGIDDRSLHHLIDYVDMAIEAAIMWNLDLPGAFEKPLPEGFDLWTFCTEFANITPPAPWDESVHQ